MQEWVTAVIGVGSFLLGLIVREIHQYFYRKERLQVLTFEKRLAAHQAAYSLCHKLNKSLNQRNFTAIRNDADQIRLWWEDNCLFLDSKSRDCMRPLIHSAYSYANEVEHPEQYDRPELRLGEKVWDNLSGCMNAIMRGIGSKHLPETTSQVVDPRPSTTGKKPWWKRIIPFAYLFVGIVMVLGIFYGFTLLPGLTRIQKVSYIVPSVSALLGLVGALIEVKNKWASLMIIFAIELFIFGMLLQLVLLIGSK